METCLGQTYLERMTVLVAAIADGDSSSVQALLDLTIPGQAPGVVARLAEGIGSIIVQNEAKAYRLELMIKDLLATHLALEQARHDPLTGLPNRAMFHEILVRQCALSLETGQLMALLFLDLDKFKDVNDTLGHQAGDELLVQVAQRLRILAEDRGVPARQGGDEFTLLMPRLKQNQEALELSGRIVSGLAQPFVLASGVVRISCSVGVSFFPSEADSPLTLLKNADVAMYKAKHDGRNTHCCYHTCQKQEC